MSVVPDRGTPKMKTGRRVSRPIAAVCAKNPASNACKRPSTWSVCSAGSYARGPRVLSRVLCRVGLLGAAAVGGAGVLAPRVQDVRQAEEQPGASSRAQAGIGQPPRQRGEVGIRELTTQQRREAGMRLDHSRL